MLTRKGEVAYVVVAPPEQSSDYLRILAKIARLLSDPSFTETLVSATSSAEIYERIESIEGGVSVEAMKGFEPLLYVRPTVADGAAASPSHHHRLDLRLAQPASYRRAVGVDHRRNGLQADEPDAILVAA